MSSNDPQERCSENTTSESVQDPKRTEGGISSETHAGGDFQRDPVDKTENSSNIEAIGKSSDIVSSSNDTGKQISPDPTEDVPSVTDSGVQTLSTVDKLSVATSSASSKVLSIEDSEDIELKWDDTDEADTSVEDITESDVKDGNNEEKKCEKEDKPREFSEQISGLDADVLKGDYNPTQLDKSFKEIESTNIDENPKKNSIDSIPDISDSKVSDTTEKSDLDSKKDSKLSKETDTSQTITADEINLSDDLKLDSDVSDGSNSFKNTDIVKLTLDNVVAKLDEIIDNSEKTKHDIAEQNIDVDEQLLSHNEELDNQMDVDIDEDKMLESPANITDNNEDVLDDLDIEMSDANIAANSTILDGDDVKESSHPPEEKQNVTAETLPDESVIEPREHNLVNPNMMIEIPTQELIDCLDDSNVSNYSLSKTEELNTEVTNADADKSNIAENLEDSLVKGKAEGDSTKEINELLITETGVSKHNETAPGTDITSAMEVDVDGDVNQEIKSDKVTDTNSYDKSEVISLEETSVKQNEVSTSKKEDVKPSIGGDNPESSTEKDNIDVNLVTTPSTSEKDDIVVTSTSADSENIQASKDEDVILTDDLAKSSILDSKVTNSDIKLTANVPQHLSVDADKDTDKAYEPKKKVIGDLLEHLPVVATDKMKDAEMKHTDDLPKHQSPDAINETKDAVKFTDIPEPLSVDAKDNAENAEIKLSDLPEHQSADPINSAKDAVNKPTYIPEPISVDAKDKAENAGIKLSDLPEHQSAINKTTDVEMKLTENLPKVLSVVTDKGKDAEKDHTDLLEPSTSVDANKDVDVVMPSTSDSVLEPEMMEADTSDEVPEISDSLGLLAESSRVMEDDEEQETSEHDDDEDDFDHEDESSNQMAAEYSEDSNAITSETETPLKAFQDFEESRVESETPVETPEEKVEFMFGIVNTVSGADAVKIVEGEMEVTEGEETKDEAMPEPITEQDITSVEAPDTLVDQPDIETVKLSDTSDTEEAEKAEPSKLKQLLTEPAVNHTETTVKTCSPKKNLQIVKPTDVFNIVDLGESSSEEATPVDGEAKTSEVTVEGADVCDVTVEGADVSDVTVEGADVCDVTVEADVCDVTIEGGDITEVSIVEDKLEGGTYGLKSKEVTIKPATTKEPMQIPEVKQKPVKEQPKESKGLMTLEVFNLDSDEEDTTPAIVPEQEKPANKCINPSCTSDPSVPQYLADRASLTYYDSSRRRRATVCETCAIEAQSLMEGVRGLGPLLSLAGRGALELVEISDSDSDPEPDVTDDHVIGLQAAQMLEDKFANMMNEVWEKYKMDDRLQDAQDELDAQIKQLELESKDIELTLSECQAATDELRNQLYATFEPIKQEQPAISIYTSADRDYMCLETAEVTTAKTNNVKPCLPRAAKRPPPPAPPAPPKRAAIPLGYSPLAQDAKQAPTPASQSTPAIDDDKDVSVVTLSAEAAPEDLPPCGDLVRPPLRVRDAVFAMRSELGSWTRGRLIEVQPKTSGQFTVCRVKFENKQQKSQLKLLPARCLAYNEPPTARMTIGTRCIALFKDALHPGRREAFYSGIVAEVPNPVNNYRYLVFFDDGYAQYVQHRDTRLVCESSPLVWEEVHQFSREFVRQYLLAYPERPMVRLHKGQSINTEWNGKWWDSRVINVDASLVQVHFVNDNRTEWIYRGSTRLAPLYRELQAAERHRARPLPRNRRVQVNTPYVEYTRSEETSKTQTTQQTTLQQQQEDIRRQRAVAKKSTSAPPAPAPAVPDTVTSRVVYYTPKSAVKPHKMSPHTCGPRCRRTDVLALRDLRTYNPLAKPLLSGWERQLVRFKGRKEVMYRAPCGRRVRSVRELHRYLRAVGSDMAVDLFDFEPATHCLAEFVLNKCIVAKKDLSNGKENVPVPCVNYYDNSLPEFCSYNTERTPTEGVPLNIDPEFLCGCDCTDDCEDKSKCACWQLTLEGARTIGLDGNVGYVYKRLPDPLPSGIYECNSRCKCKSTCLNRVAQHPLQLKLQVFKTLNRGWGIRALNDVPKGAFLCVYAGNLLTDATANLDGLNEGDEYLAELDYIEVVEQMKEGFEEDVPEADKKLDKEAESESSSESGSEDEDSKDEREDGDFQPGYVPLRVTTFSKRLRKREKSKKAEEQKEAAEKKEKEGQKNDGDEDCITISDDEELREPSRFMAQAGMGREFVSKYKSVRALFGKDEACYIMDAKVQGNIGRYLNHSCSPNVFVQNVFVDTHDPRFPWVAFFALLPIRAGTELTWNYNYDVGSVPGKVLYCHCQAPNCRGRLL